MENAEMPSERSIWLWNDGEYNTDSTDGFRPWLDPYPIENSGTAKGAVIVFPGGGYEVRAPHEAGAIARNFNEYGYNAFVVHYSVAPKMHPQMLLDASRAIRIVRSRSSEWNVNPDKLAVCGFSAGGHLAASIGVHYDKPYLTDSSESDRVSNRPDALILCYPVINSGPYAHTGSFRALLGADASDEMLAEMSLEKQVNSSTPPSFLWHTAEDDAVPVENSLLFANALSASKVPFELHVYSQGRHGLGLGIYEYATDVPLWLKRLASWADLCADWLKTMNF